MIPDRKADRAHIQEEETPRPCLPQRLSWQNPHSKGGGPLRHAVDSEEDIPGPQHPKDSHPQPLPLPSRGVIHSKEAGGQCRGKFSNSRTAAGQLSQTRQ